MKGNDSLKDYKLGEKIECNGYIGTVKYVGPVEGKSGSWLGVDWHNPNRGKHNGNINNVQYFTARHATSGSFVRPEKANLGKSAADSLIARYGEDEDEVTAHINRQNQLKLQQNMKAPFLQMVGFDKVFSKQSDLNTLKIADLRFQNVSHSGDLSICPSMTELDVSKNLFNSWSDIFSICEQLQFLEWLNVSENLLTFPEDYKNYHFPNMKVLICGQMELTWIDVIKIFCIFPNVEEFRCPFNNIKEISETSSFEKLRLFDIEGNEIRHWSEICKFDCAPQMEHLVLENVGLESIRFEAIGRKVPIFRNLEKLCLSNNLISDWESISELDRLEKLESLKISKNPVLELEDRNTTFQLLIAKLGNLKVINGVEIEITERKGAEYDYLKKYGLEWLNVKETEKKENFFKSHPRYLELIELYGEPEKAELEIKSKTINTNLVTLNITYQDKSIIKKVPLSISVQKFTILIEKLFKVNEKPHLICINSNYPNIFIELDDDLKELAMYSVQDGDEIIVKTD